LSRGGYRPRDPDEDLQHECVGQLAPFFSQHLGADRLDEMRDGYRIVTQSAGGGRQEDVVRVPQERCSRKLAPIDVGDCFRPSRKFTSILLQQLRRRRFQAGRGRWQEDYQNFLAFRPINALIQTNRSVLDVADCARHQFESTTRGSTGHFVGGGANPTNLRVLCVSAASSQACCLPMSLTTRRESVRLSAV
jgi:hypothetical protein